MKGVVLLSNCRLFFLLTEQVSHWRNTHFAQKASLYALIPQVDIQLTRIRYRGVNKLEITVTFFKMSRLLYIAPEYFAKNRPRILLFIVFYKTYSALQNFDIVETSIGVQSLLFNLAREQNLSIVLWALISD